MLITLFFLLGEECWVMDEGWWVMDFKLQLNQIVKNNHKLSESLITNYSLLNFSPLIPTRCAFRSESQLLFSQLQYRPEQRVCHNHRRECVYLR